TVYEMSGKNGIGFFTEPLLSGIWNVSTPPVTLPPPPESTFVITEPRFAWMKSRPLRVTRTPAELPTRSAAGNPFGITCEPAHPLEQPPPPQPATKIVAPMPSAVSRKEANDERRRFEGRQAMGPPERIRARPRASRSTRGGERREVRARNRTAEARG